MTKALAAYSAFIKILASFTLVVVILFMSSALVVLFFPLNNLSEFGRLIDGLLRFDIYFIF